MGKFYIFDSAGDMVQNYTYGNTNAYRPRSIDLDNGNVAVTFSNSPANLNIINSSGDIIATDTFGGSGAYYKDIAKFSNGNFIVAFNHQDSVKTGRFRIYNQDGVMLKEVITHYALTGDVTVNVTNNIARITHSTGSPLYDIYHHSYNENGIQTDPDITLDGIGHLGDSSAVSLFNNNTLLTYENKSSNAAYMKIDYTY